MRAGTDRLLAQMYAWSGEGGSRGGDWYLLSGPPSLVTASTKRSCRSGVQRSRGLGSRDSTTPAPTPYPARSIPSNMMISSELSLLSVDLDRASGRPLFAS